AWRSPSARPEPMGAVGASPAATAAWLGPQEPDPATPYRSGGPVRAARRYLEAATVLRGGPGPCATPIAPFERGWVLSWLLRAGIPVKVPAQLAGELHASLGPGGSPGGPGLPPDADTSAGVLYALSLAGSPHPPDLLWDYETDTHFCT